MPLPFFQNLTNTAVVDPNGQVQYVPDAQALQAANTANPSPYDMSMAVMQNQAPPNTAKMQKPSFMQATNPIGGNLTNPSLTKGGKLLSILLGAGKGAAAGAGQRTFGEGLQQGSALPFMQAMRPMEMQKEQAQIDLLKAQSQMVQTPYGLMNAGLAKVIFPAMIKGQAQTQAAQIGAGGRIQAAQIEKRFIPVPNVGLFDTQSREVIPETQQGITITPEIANDFKLPNQFIGKPMSLMNLASVQRSSVFENVPQMTAQGPIIVNRRNAQATPVSGPGGQQYTPSALASPREVADPNNPGETLVVPAGQSFGRAGVQSASVQVPKKAAAAEVPRNIGDLKVAFTTAIQHADLLQSAASALNNGDQQTLNSLKNRFKNEFGGTGPITAQVIADAYGREVTKMLSAGHMTDNEIATVGYTVNPNKQNFAQSMAVLQAYRALAQSKMNMLNQQKQSAIRQSQPKSRQANIPENTGTVRMRAPNGQEKDVSADQVEHYKSKGATVIGQ